MGYRGQAVSEDSLINKYGACKTYSNLCKRNFDSKLECKRAEELYLLQLGGVITDLDFQHKFVLSDEPKVTYTVDFVYRVIPDEPGHYIYEDAKGALTRETRVKIAWVREKYGIEVLLWPER